MTDYQLALAKGKKVSRAAAFLQFLKQHNIKDEQTYRKAAITASLIAFFIIFLLSNLWISLFTSFFLFSLLFNLPSYLASKYREELECHLVPALYAAARMPKGTPSSKVISRLAEMKEFGLLSELFASINAHYSKASGRHSYSHIFRKFSSTIGSSKLERMFEILNLGLKHNKDANSILLKSAEDLEDIELLLRQRRSQLTSQKLTLLFSSAILLPAILSATSEILSILVSSGVGNFANPQVLFNSLLGYTLLEAIFAAVWLSYSIEQRKSALALYLPTLTLLAMAVFTIVGGLI